MTNRRPRGLDFWLCLSALSVVLALVWVIPLWPSQDAYSHLYSAHVVAQLWSDPASPFAEHFAANLGPHTNTLFHWVIVALSPVLSPWVAHKVFVSLYLVVMVVALRRFVAAVRPEALRATPLYLPLLLSYPFFMGFYNYVLAVPLALLGLTVVIGWLRNEGRAGLLVLTLLSVLVFLGHVACSLVLAGAVLVWCIRARETPRMRRLLPIIVTVGVPLFLVVLQWATSNGGAEAAPGPELGFKAPWDNVASLVWHAGISFSYAEGAVSGALLAAIVGLLAARTVWHKRRRLAWSRDDATLLWCLGGLFVAFLVTPYSLAYFHYVNTRAILFLYLFTAPLWALPGPLGEEPSSPRSPRWAPWLGAGLLALQLVLLWTPLTRGSAQLEAIRDQADDGCLASLRGQPVLPLRHDAQTFSDHVRWRASLWALPAIDGDPIAPLAFAFRHAFPLRFRSDDWPGPSQLSVDGATFSAHLDVAQATLLARYAGAVAFPDEAVVQTFRLDLPTGVWEAPADCSGRFLSAVIWRAGAAQ